MGFRKHPLVLSALIAFAATFWLQTPTQAAPPDIRLSLSCYPQTGLVATIAWVSNPEASGQWIDLVRLTEAGEVYEGAGPFPAEVNNHAMAVRPYSVYTVRIAEYVAVSAAWATSPTFYFETGNCAPGASPAPCTFPLCGGEFAGGPPAGAPMHGPMGSMPMGNPNVNYPAFPPTIVPYPGTAFAPPYAGQPGTCHPSYVGACLVVGTGDFDCMHGIGEGPNIVKGTLLVVGPDTYALDTNGDGVACSGPPDVFETPKLCQDRWSYNGWWGDKNDWHDDWDHDGWDDKDWDKHDWDNNHDKWGHDNGCYGGAWWYDPYSAHKASWYDNHDDWDHDDDWDDDWD